MSEVNTQKGENSKAPLSAVNGNQQEGKTIKRKYKIFLNEKVQKWSPLPENLRGDTSKELGSFWDAKTQEVFRPLDKDVENFLMPDIIGLKPSEIGYHQKLREYWANWTFLPTVDGKELNASTVFKFIPTASGEKELKEVPVNLSDYIVYKNALHNPVVASSSEELEDLGNWEFYLLDLYKDKVERESLSAIELKIDKYKVELFSDHAANVNKINALVRVLAKAGEVSTYDSMSEKVQFLQKKAKETIKKDTNGVYYNDFYRAVENPLLLEESFVYELIDNSVIVKSGETYFFENDALGTFKEAVSMLGKAENQKLLIALQNTLKEKVKNNNL